MKKRLLGVLFLTVFSLLGEGILELFDIDKYKDSPAGKILFSNSLIEKQEIFERAKNDQQADKKLQSEDLTTQQAHLDRVTTSIEDTKGAIKNAPAEEQEFLNKKLSLENEISQTIRNIQLERKQIGSNIDQTVKVWEEYFKDPGFKSLVTERHALTTYGDVKSLSEKVVNQEDELRHLQEKKSEAAVERENRQRKAAASTKEYQEKSKIQENFGTQSATLLPEEGQGYRQQAELIDLEQQLLGFEKTLAELRVQESNRKITLLDSLITIAGEKLKILKTNLLNDISALRIEKNDIQAAREKLDKRKQESLATREGYYQTIKQLTTERDKLNKELEALRKRYNVTAADMRDIVEWDRTARSPEMYTTICDISSKYAQIASLDSKIDYLRAQIDLETVKFKREEVSNDIMNAWYRLTQRTFKIAEDGTQEIKHFKSLQTQALRDEGSFKDKRNTLTNTLSIENKTLSNLKAFSERVKEQKDALFKRYPQRYTGCLIKLEDSEKKLSDQIESNTKLLEVYSTTVTTLSGMVKDLSGIISELESKSFWKRSEYAITWQGIKNIVPDFVMFGNDLKYLAGHYFSKRTYETIIRTVSVLFSNIRSIVLFLAYIFALFVLFIILKRYLPVLSRWLLRLKFQNKALMVLTQSAAGIIAFIATYAGSLYCWSIIAILVHTNVINELFWHVLFYLGSMIYLSYCAYKFVHFFINFNREQGYSIFVATFEKRFIFVFSLFAYLTIIILSLREAFLLATYQKSELPTILLALYSIIIRTLIIFSIGKEELLSFIPTRSAAWALVADFIDRYYYLLLTGIIVLMMISDPYVGGYGNVVSYVLWGIVGTLILIKVLIWLQSYCRRAVYYIFFYQDEEVIKERFAYAKTWYGLSAIILFVISLCVGIFIGAKIWGKTITFHDITTILNVELLSTGIDEKTGTRIWLTPLKIAAVAGIIFAGFLVAAAINRFVIYRIFELLPVDVGIQNTVVSISRYFIIFAAIFAAFQWAGLGWLFFALGALLAGIGYIVKEPVSDFISYFIILVQRPIKIGDYIEIDHQVYGVVRQITPRSVILRKKDSYTIVLPNATLINQPVHNWNYSRNFVGLDDITFTIPYGTDTQLVKSLINQVLEKNITILKSPRPVVRLEAFGENGYNFMVRCFVSEQNTLMRWDIASDIRFSLVKIFSEHSIKIAVPTRFVIGALDKEAL